MPLDVVHANSIRPPCRFLQSAFGPAVHRDFLVFPREFAANSVFHVRSSPVLRGGS